MVLQVLFLNVWDHNSVIIVFADVLAPDNARPSEGKFLIEICEQELFWVCAQPMRDDITL